MEKQNIEICMVCGKDIILDEDSYVLLRDFFKGKFHSEGYYHNKCYLDRLNKKSKLQGMAEKLVNRANKVMDLSGVPKEEEEYIIA